MTPLTCPHCGVSLQGAPIPEASRHYYGEATHFGRTIMVEIRGVYDGGLFFQCPDCGGRWHRWPKGDRLHTAAIPYVGE